MSSAQPAELQRTIDRLDREARDAKREERRQRRAAQEKRRQLDELVAFAKAHGIPVIYQA